MPIRFTSRFPLPLALCAVLLPVPLPAAFAADPEPEVIELPAFPGPDINGEGVVEDPDIELLERLKLAEQFYDEGVARFRQGQAFNGRDRLKRAFSILTASLDEERLPIELRSDFLSMLEKVRAWERPGEGNEEPSELDVSEEDLKETPASPGPKTNSREAHAIRIDPANELTEKFIHLYTKKRPASVEDALARSGRYREMIEGSLSAAGLPHELFYLVMAESEYKMHAVSRSGAAGLWQFMPFTARKYGLEVSYWVDERFHPEKATRAALRYLSDLYQWFGDWHLALAAYNRGENGIGRDLKFSRSADFGVLSARRALPRETHNYVPKFMACVLIGENPAEYGLHPKYEKPEPYDTVLLKRDLDLAIAAKAAGTTKEVIRRLNPHIRAWCTPKKRAHFEFRIPEGSKEKFLDAIAKIKNWNPGPRIVRYKIRRGDFLGRIARKYRTTVKAIVRLNKIRNARLIRPGMKLKIRPGKAFYRGGGKKKIKKRRRRKR